MAGYTESGDFPTTSGAYDNSHNGYRDVFISKLSPNLDALLASTFLGGSKYDFFGDFNGDDGKGIALVSDGIYIVGTTSSTDFPMAGTPYDDSPNGGYDIFISKLSLGLDNLIASTYLGGTYSDVGVDVAVANDGVYVTGYTISTDFPITSGAADNTI